MGKGTLGSVHRALDGWLKPGLLGESWDNIGLLVGSGLHSEDEKPVKNILLCNDLTSNVVTEAVDKKIDLIIAYHPPIFAPLKALGYGSWKQQIIARCLAHDIAVYSPHTTLDAAIGGINDRIMSYFSAGAPGSSTSLLTIGKAFVDESCNGIEYRSTPENLALLYASVPFGDLNNVSVGFDVEALLNENGKSAAMRIYPLKDTDVNFEQITSIASKLDVPDFKSPGKAPSAALGSGRILRFQKPVHIDGIVEQLRACTGVPKIKLARGPKSEIQSIALCVGSGASILKGLKVDVVVTGEMSHHEVLDCLEDQQSVILCGHADSERHYLPTLKEIVKIVTQCPNVVVSQADQSLFQFV